MIREAAVHGMHRRMRRLRHAAFAPAMMCVGLVIGTGFTAAQEKTAQNPPASATNSGSAPADGARKAEQEKTSPLRKALKEKKVLTEDDLRPTPKLSAEGNEEERDFNPVCNPDCEEMVRSQMGVEPEHELEFRNQFTVASQAIGKDQAWNNVLYDSTKTAAAYCDWKRKNPQPSSQQSISAILQGRDLWWKFKDKEGWLKKRLQDVERDDAFRATIMRNQWQVAYYGSCQDLQVP